ncbi:FHIPEP family type III secretion protein [bacterium]|nr:FHIPEP family type III secretion protein [bacterium]
MIERIKNILKLNRKKSDVNIYAKIDEMFDTLGVDELCIHVGEDLLPHAEEICNKIWDLRRKLKDKTGLIIPAVRVLDNLGLQENEYQIMLRGKNVFTGFTVPKEDYASNEITRNLEQVCMDNLEIVLTNEMIEKYIEFVQRNNSWLVWYLARLIPTTGIKVILADLIRNGKSINDITYIFEKICEQATRTRDIYTIPDAHKIAENLKLELK